MLDQIDHRKLLDDDEPTLSRFVEGLGSLALGIARGRYRFSREEGEEIALEVLKKLWDRDRAALRAWRGQGSLKTYLSAIIHRFCLMELRRRKRRVVEQPTEQLDRFQAATDPLPLERQQLQEVYRRAAAKLSSRDQRLLRFRFVEEQDYPAITSELGISHGAARKAVHSALGRLRERLRATVPELFPTRPEG